ncbi:hypothetical protein ACIQC0_09965 [Pseudarthrobacter sp. NPDC092419]|uniref:hypothetical protein n=1 Tax=Pseudarthrobacter sp. NPDC092419 TaxID=3364414 RepID=UPI00382325AB
MEIQLSGSSMEELRERVRSRYGPDARIVSAEAVTVGGIKGYLARRHYEVTVRVPELQQQRSAAVRPRAGIAALLAEADQVEAGSGPAAAAAKATAPAVSTMSGGFDELVKDLARSTGAMAKLEAQPGDGAAPGVRGRRAYRAPRPGRYPGDLTVVVGLQTDALKVCQDMAQDAAAAGGVGTADVYTRGVYTGGSHAAQGYLPLGNRAGAVAARAAGVEGGYPVFVAWGIGSARGGGMDFAGLASLAADQVWVAVDARMKEADTASWVGAVKAAVEVTGLAVEHSHGTSTPESVNRLEVPVGWLDGRPSPAPRL